MKNHLYYPPKSQPIFDFFERNPEPDAPFGDKLPPDNELPTQWPLKIPEELPSKSQFGYVKQYVFS